jgi:predicted DNA-binding transcriptional regulator AlpA
MTPRVEPGTPLGAGDLLTVPQLSARLAVPASTLSKWRLARTGPPYYRLAGGQVRYSAAELAAWLAASRVAG